MMTRLNISGSIVYCNFQTSLDLQAKQQNSFRWSYHDSLVIYVQISEMQRDHLFVSH